MRIPNFVELREERAACQGKGLECGSQSYASGIHPKPRFYKYWWWVFWNESEADGVEFITERYRLNSAAAFRLMDELRSQNEPFWLYNTSLPRLDPSNPFDVQSPRWKKSKWAPSFDADLDPTVEIEGLEHK